MGNEATLGRVRDEGRVSLSPLTLLAIVVASRVPFLLTHHVQDDAYISFRAIRNLVEHGSLAFNAGDRYSPVTSLLWSFVGAIPASLTSADTTALGFQLLGVLSIWLAVLAVRSLLRSSWAVLFLAISSPALFASYLGMETGLCILFLVLIAVCLQELPRRARPLYVLAVMGPVVRPEYITVTALVVALVLAAPDLPRRDRLFFLTAPLLASLLYVTLNLLLSGMPVSATAVAKTLAYEPQRSLRLFLPRFGTMLSGQLILPGVKQVPAIAYVFANLAPLLLLAWRLFRGERLVPAERRLLLFMAFVAYGLPAIFCWGGQFAQWYLFPCGFFALLMALWCAPKGAHASRPVAVAMLGMAFAVAIAQLLFSFSAGVQEYGYRADVGRWIGRNSSPRDTLMLEPAGYIPFYAGLRTHDYVGLVSPVMLDYLRIHGQRAWFPFVRDLWPDWIVDRHDLRTAGLTDSGYRLSPAESRCFLARYEMVRFFHYDPTDYARNPFALRLLRLGSHADYYVYHLKARALPAACSGLSAGPVL
jgi:hypothetical protein